MKVEVRVLARGSSGDGDSKGTEDRVGRGTCDG